MLCVFLEHIPSPLFAGMLMHDVGFDTHLVMSQNIYLYVNVPKLFDDIFAHSIVNSYQDNETKFSTLDTMYLNFGSYHCR